MWSSLVYDLLRTTPDDTADRLATIPVSLATLVEIANAAREVPHLDWSNIQRNSKMPVGYLIRDKLVEIFLQVFPAVEMQTHSIVTLYSKLLQLWMQPLGGFSWFINSVLWPYSEKVVVNKFDHLAEIMRLTLRLAAANRVEQAFGTRCHDLKVF